MPGFITHYLIGRDIYQTLPASFSKQMIRKHLSAYTLGLQGPDLFFYYLPSFRNSEKPQLGSLMHRKDTGKFFSHMIECTENLEGDNQIIAFSYLCGFLGHYAADTNCHPYIYSRTNFRLGKTEDLNQYHSEHRNYETLIDSVLLDRILHKKNSQFRKSDTVKLSEAERDVISQMLAISITKTYCTIENNRSPISSKQVKNALTSIYLECQLLLDRSGWKKKIIREIERSFLHYDFANSMIGEDDYHNDNDCLNESHEDWVLPWAEDTLKTESFTDLYQASVARGTDILKHLFQYFDHLKAQPDSILLIDEKELLLKEIGNHSYHSGQDCSEIDF